MESGSGSESSGGGSWHNIDDTIFSAWPLYAAFLRVAASTAVVAWSVARKKGCAAIPGCRGFPIFPVVGDSTPNAIASDVEVARQLLNSVNFWDMPLMFGRAIGFAQKSEYQISATHLSASRRIAAHEAET